MNNVESANVERWRLEQFEKMGFGRSASILLTEWGTDLQKARDLIGKGCPPNLAMRILRPLDDRPSYSADAVERIAQYSNAA